MKSEDTGESGTLEISAQRLRGKQSVRATFRLSEQMIDLLKVAAAHLEVQQKSLIDELVHNRRTLDRVAAESRNTEQQDQKRRQKTFVVSRNSLALLDDISGKYDLSRDYLVERCIARLIPFVDAEQEKHEQRRQLIKDIDRLLAEGKKVLKKANGMLGPDDRFRIKLETMINQAERNIKELKKSVREQKSLLY
ncbi:MAG: hypothetical protein LJE64_11640 [Desulfofustis sp.]|jgi:hypothetical protein|nr:hypothetical protein [Desulfofustis sp.]